MNDENPDIQLKSGSLDVLTGFLGAFLHKTTLAGAGGVVSDPILALRGPDSILAGPVAVYEFRGLGGVRPAAA
jgi:hypothetical protein